MRNNKLKRFNDLLTFPNVYENFDEQKPALTGHTGDVVDYRGAWNEKHFNNHLPVVLELACGGGEYTLGMSQRYPDTNFIGVDIKGARIWKGAKMALEAGIQNAAFLRIRIEQIALFFGAREVSEIWITFPDPFLRNSKAKNRLTSPRFLAEYRKILSPGGIVHLKTDEMLLYEYTLEVLAGQPDFKLLYANSDIYAGPLPFPELGIRTFYEHKHLTDGKTIKYIRFAWEGNEVLAL